MSVVDPRELSDRALFAYLLFGDLPRAGWNRRGVLVRCALLVVGLTALVGLALVAVSGLIVLAWAAGLPR